MDRGEMLRKLFQGSLGRLLARLQGEPGPAAKPGSPMVVPQVPAQALPMPQEDAQSPLEGIGRAGQQALSLAGRVADHHRIPRPPSVGALRPMARIGRPLGEVGRRGIGVSLAGGPMTALRLDADGWGDDFPVWLRLPSLEFEEGLEADLPDFGPIATEEASGATGSGEHPAWAPQSRRGVVPPGRVQGPTGARVVPALGQRQARRGGVSLRQASNHPERSSAQGAGGQSERRVAPPEGRATVARRVSHGAASRWATSLPPVINMKPVVGRPMAVLSAKGIGVVRPWAPADGRGHGASASKGQASRGTPNTLVLASPAEQVSKGSVALYPVERGEVGPASAPAGGTAALPSFPAVTSRPSFSMAGHREEPALGLESHAHEGPFGPTGQSGRMPESLVHGPLAAAPEARAVAGPAPSRQRLEAAPPGPSPRTALGQGRAGLARASTHAARMGVSRRLASGGGMPLLSPRPGAGPVAGAKDVVPHADTPPAGTGQLMPALGWREGVVPWQNRGSQAASHEGVLELGLPSSPTPPAPTEKGRARMGVTQPGRRAALALEGRPLSRVKTVPLISRGSRGAEAMALHTARLRLDSGLEALPVGVGSRPVALARTSGLTMLRLEKRPEEPPHQPKEAPSSNPHQALLKLLESRQPKRGSLPLARPVVARPSGPAMPREGGPEATYEVLRQAMASRQGAAPAPGLEVSTNGAYHGPAALRVSRQAALSRQEGEGASARGGGNAVRTPSTRGGQDKDGERRRMDAEEIEYLASKMYSYFKRKLTVERERLGQPPVSLPW